MPVLNRTFPLIKFSFLMYPTLEENLQSGNNNGSAFSHLTLFEYINVLGCRCGTFFSKDFESRLLCGCISFVNMVNLFIYLFELFWTTYLFYLQYYLFIYFIWTIYLNFLPIIKFDHIPVHMCIITCLYPGSWRGHVTTRKRNFCRVVATLWY